MPANAFVLVNSISAELLTVPVVPKNAESVGLKYGFTVGVGVPVSDKITWPDV
jgi:hypothetical protein